MWTIRAHVPLALRSTLTIVVASLAPACGAGLESTARDELAERGFESVTLQPLERDDDAFSFTARRAGVPCTGEIEFQEQLGQTLATVSDHCGETE